MLKKDLVHPIVAKSEYFETVIKVFYLIYVILKTFKFYFVF
jgi:hypothetical protein